MNIEIENYLEQNQAQADKYIQVFILVFFVFGVVIAPIYNTWVFALGIGGINMVLFFVATFLLKNKYLARMIVSGIFALYMLQFIGQMHGMAELHFFFFINIAILIIYQDWRLMVPYTIIAVGHHSIFFVLQLQGTEGLGTYFINYTKVTYITLIFHFGLAILMAVVCGLWAIVFKNTSLKIKISEIALDLQKIEIKESMEFLLAMSRGDFSKEINPKNPIDYALLNTKEKLKEASQKDEIEAQRTKRLLDISEALRNHQNVQSLGKSIVQVFLQSFDFACMSVYALSNKPKEIKAGEDFIEKPFLYLVAQQGCTKENIPTEILVGEGLLGEVANIKQTMYLDIAQFETLTQNTPVIQSGIGQTKSPFTLIIPLCVNQNLVGVMSMCAFKPINVNDRGFLGEMAESIARTFIAVETINQNEKLLSESQNLTQELRSSEEELRQNLEEVNAIRDTVEAVTLELTIQLEEKNQKIAFLEKQIETLMQIND